MRRFFKKAIQYSRLLNVTDSQISKICLRQNNDKETKYDRLHVLFKRQEKIIKIWKGGSLW